MTGVRPTKQNLGKQILCALCVTTTASLCACVTTTTVNGRPVPNERPKTTRPAQAAVPTAATTASAPLSEQSTEAAIAAATRQVIATEQAFAKTMADRNFKAFVNFLSPNAVFFNGREVARGPAAVAANWQAYFTARSAPFSWAPDHVEVSPSGDLALSTGPVFQDKKIVGRFNSIWRLEAPNTWRIVFDKGEAVCDGLP
jgi:ketosteroid isomerase-like protein